MCLHVLLRRRVYIPLPGLAARRTILEHHIGDRLAGDGGGRGGGGGDATATATTKDEVLDACAAKTAGYSGADLRLVCKEAAMHPLRSLVHKLEAGGQVCTCIRHDEVMSACAHSQQLTCQRTTDTRAGTRKPPNQRILTHAYARTQSALWMGSTCTVNECRICVGVRSTSGSSGSHNGSEFGGSVWFGC